jgi:hypothetical protein
MRLAVVLLAIVILVILLLALVQKAPTSAPEERSEDYRLEQLKSIMPEEKARKFIEKYGFLAVENRFNDTVLNFARIFAMDEGLADYIKLKNSSTMILMSKNESLLKEIHRNSLFDKSVKDKYKQTEDASNLILELNLADKSLYSQTIHAIGNLTNAFNSLPSLDRSTIWLLTNATQNPVYGKNIVDFEPIVIKDAAGTVHVFKSSDVARDTWMIAYLLKERPALAEQGKKFEWINRMIQQVAWDIFDDIYGPNGKWVEPTCGKEHLPEYLKPADGKVWEVILGFHDYMDSLPSKLQKDKIPIAFPYWDSDLLKQVIADKTNRTIALFYLADLPSSTFNPNTKQFVIGIEGMKLFVKQLPIEYEKIKEAYPDEKVYAWGKERDIRVLYYDWLDDRYYHGLSNTVDQFVGGWEVNKYHNPYGNIEWLQSKNGIDQFLTNNWKPWDLIKFIYAYERYNSGEWSGEWEMYDYGLPIAFKAFGIPHGAHHGTFSSNIFINIPKTLVDAGAPNIEWSVTLPDYVISSLKSKFSGIVIGYGNYFGLFSCKDGLIKDSSEVNEILQPIRDAKYICLWRK